MPRPAAVLLTGQAWGGTLHAMRSLHALGAPVLVASHGRGADVYGRSRACTAAVDLPAVDGADLIDALVAWVAPRVPEGPVVVIPTSDRLLAALDAGRAVLPERFRVVGSRPEVNAVLVDKARAAAAAETAGLDVLPWVVVRGVDDLPALEPFDGPVVVRPTGFGTAGRRPFKVVRVEAPEQVAVTVQGLVEAGAEVIVQRAVDVPDHAVEWALCWRSGDGSRTVVVTGRKRRQAAADGGVMVWGETQPIPELEAATRRFLDAVGFVGLGGLEVLREGDRRWFVELNPRLEAIHFVATRAGVDLVELAYLDTLGKSVPADLPSPGAAAGWVGSAWSSRLRAEPRWWPTALADRLRFQRHPARVRAIWDRRDPGPSLALVRRAARAGRRR